MTQFSIGQRVVHRNTEGRIRGTVEEIRIGRKRTVVRVMVEFAGGRKQDFDYVIENLVDETEWDAGHAVSSESTGEEGE